MKTYIFKVSPHGRDDSGRIHSRRTITVSVQAESKLSAVVIIREMLSDWSCNVMTDNLEEKK